MGCFSGRCMLIFVCVLQLITAVERQVFDFLGYQWAPILVNFLHIIVVILGLFGTIQYRPRYVVLYLTWAILWIGWNIFVCCLYLDLGNLSKDSNYLSLGVSSHASWWKENAPGCDDAGDLFATRWQSLESPALVSSMGCLLEYQYIEVVHSALQLFISLLGFVFACYVISVFNEEDTFDFVGGFDQFPVLHGNEKASHLFL